MIFFKKKLYNSYHYIPSIGKYLRVCSDKSFRKIKHCLGECLECLIIGVNNKEAYRVVDDVFEKIDYQIAVELTEMYEIKEPWSKK